MPERADKFTFLLVGIIAGIFIEELIGVGTRTLSSVQQGSVGPPLSPSNSICEGLLYQQQQQLTKQADAAAKAAMNAAAAAARQHNEQPCPAAPARAPECPPPPA